MSENFDELVLRQHNYYRKKHGSPALRLNPELCIEAQKHAEELAKIDRLAHSQSHHGENLYTQKLSRAIDKAMLAELACQGWYSEEQRHRYDREPKDPCTSHFTQMVWCTTTDLGVGYGLAKSGAHYVVCNYMPPGNFVGQFIQNVHVAKN